MITKYLYRCLPMSNFFLAEVELTLVDLLVNEVNKNYFRPMHTLYLEKKTLSLEQLRSKIVKIAKPCSYVACVDILLEGISFLVFGETKQNPAPWTIFC